jgi:hypothetical protein
LSDAALVIAARNEEPTIWKRDCGAAATACLHAGASNPNASPHVEHFYGVKGALPIPAPKGIELVRQRAGKAKKRCDILLE